MADVAHDSAGLASGVMTTAHELGAAVGVAILSAVATAGQGLVDGFHDAFVVAAAVALGVAVIAFATMPSVRPQPGIAHGIH